MKLFIQSGDLNRVQIVPYPHSNAYITSFTTQSTNSICLNMGTIGMTPTKAVLASRYPCTLIRHLSSHSSNN